MFHSIRPVSNSFLLPNEIKRKKEIIISIAFYVSLSLTICGTFFHSFSKDAKKLFLSNVTDNQMTEIIMKGGTSIFSIFFFILFFLILLPKFCHDYLQVISFSLCLFMGIVFLFSKAGNTSLSSISAFSLLKQLGKANSTSQLAEIPASIINAKDNAFFVQILNAIVSNIFDYFSPIVLMGFTTVFLTTEVKNTLFKDDNSFQISCSEVGVLGGLFYSLFSGACVRFFSFTNRDFISNSTHVLVFLSILICIHFYILQQCIKKYRDLEGIDSTIRFEKDIITELGFKGLYKVIKVFFLNPILLSFFLSEFMFFGLQVLLEFFNSSIIKRLSLSGCKFKPLMSDMVEKNKLSKRETIDQMFNFVKTVSSFCPNSKDRIVLDSASCSCFYNNLNSPKMEENVSEFLLKNISLIEKIVVPKTVFPSVSGKEILVTDVKEKIKSELVDLFKNADFSSKTNIRDILLFNINDFVDKIYTNLDNFNSTHTVAYLKNNSTTQEVFFKKNKVLEDMIFKFFRSPYQYNREYDTSLLKESSVVFIQSFIDMFCSDKTCLEFEDLTVVNCCQSSFHTNNINKLLKTGFDPLFKEGGMPFIFPEPVYFNKFFSSSDTSLDLENESNEVFISDHDRVSFMTLAFMLEDQRFQPLWDKFNDFNSVLENNQFILMPKDLFYDGDDIELPFQSHPTVALNAKFISIFRVFYCYFHDSLYSSLAKEITETRKMLITSFSLYIATFFYKVFRILIKKYLDKKGKDKNAITVENFKMINIYSHILITLSLLFSVFFFAKGREAFSFLRNVIGYYFDEVWIKNKTLNNMFNLTCFILVSINVSLFRVCKYVLMDNMKTNWCINSLSKSSTRPVRVTMDMLTSRALKDLVFSTLMMSTINLLNKKSNYNQDPFVYPVFPCVFYISIIFIWFLKERNEKKRISISDYEKKLDISTLMSIGK